MATKFLNANATGSEYSVWVDTAATATAVKVSNIALNLRAVECNNASGGIVYFKAAENADAISGTTVPEYVLRIPNSTHTRIMIPGGQAMTALSYWVTQGGGDTNDVAPGGTVTVRLVFA